MIALIDRDDAAALSLDAFDPQKFYAFADENDAVHIRWLDAVPPPACAPMRKRARQKKNTE